METTAAGRYRWLNALLNGISLFGYAFGAWELIVLNSRGLEVRPDTQAYLRAGHALLSGAPVYLGQIGDPLAFNYAPPWALLFASLTLLPPTVAQFILMSANAAALRYVAGSWRRVGYCLLFPLTGLFLASGNIDLIIAAAIVAAWQGAVWPLALVGLAKLAPFLGLPLRRWREAIITVAIAAVVTLPWWHLWPEWVVYLSRQPISIRNGVAIAWWMRLPLALLLLAFVRRPWASALAVVVAMPSLYAWTTMEGLAVLRIWWDGRVAQTAAAGSADLPRGHTWRLTNRLDVR